MNGTNRLDLIVGHGAEFLLTTGNGFAITTTHGARNVLIEEMANFTFIEKSHQRVPMWNVFGNFIVKEGASVSVINTYMTTPSDNYNIYFKGTNQKFILKMLMLYIPIILLILCLVLVELICGYMLLIILLLVRLMIHQLFIGIKKIHQLK